MLFEQFGGGLWRDNGADIAPVQHCAARLLGKGALPLIQGGAHRGMHRDATGQAATGLAAQFGVGQQRVGKGAGGCGVLGRIGVAAVQQHLSAHGAIQHAGVEVRQAVMRGQCPGDGALAAGGGAVDGDDEGGVDHGR